MAASRAKRKPIRSRVENSAASSLRTSSTHDPGLGLFSSKRDKRTVKHTTFISKIEKSHAKKQKKRRPSKKLVANLESLADALPDAGEDESGQGLVVGDVRIRHKSLKSRPGALKRKGKVEKMERERFSRNLAQMVGKVADADASETPTVKATQEQEIPLVSPSTSIRWAALRGFVSHTLERKPEFE